jgi:hypothetical protein
MTFTPHDYLKHTQQAADYASRGDMQSINALVAELTAQNAPAYITNGVRTYLEAAVLQQSRRLSAP